MIVIGIIMYIFGSIGCVSNIYVFTKWSFSTRNPTDSHRKVRLNNSSLYLLTTAIANLILIIYPLAVRIIVDGFGYLVTNLNEIFLCQIRYYILQTALMISLICTCLATIDRYLITSRTVRLRHLSASRHLTKQIIIFVVILTNLHSIPTAIYYNRSRVYDCTISSLIYANYYLYFVVVFLYGIFPICFLSIFGLLTYKNLRTLKRTDNTGSLIRDKQLSEMVLFQCLALVFSYIPYCIQQIYFSKIHQLNGPPTSFDLLFRIVTIILFYVNPVTSFYIFFISTPNFRRQIKNIVLCHNHHVVNRIYPLTIANDGS
ncbi:unnamed protein product [Adineta ricciae]|uniref:G-protein coupled receptors family 1 profile domain-containing protein n=1 Tax=Adineta ricciae TaxID=249248 RepID=A0A815ZJK3_ADIRI|nr:unnamed protein product [Adineta ricciae]